MEDLTDKSEQIISTLFGHSFKTIKKITTNHDKLKSFINETK